MRRVILIEQKQAVTRFVDMHSGGYPKLEWNTVFINLPHDEAERVFKEEFGINPRNVTCSCCGPAYSISEYSDLDAATKYLRRDLTVPKYFNRYDVLYIHVTKIEEDVE